MEDLSDFEVEFEDDLIPQEIVQKAEETADELLPDKSRCRYEGEYAAFQKWMDKNHVKVVGEVVLLAYFKDLVCNVTARFFVVKYACLQWSMWSRLCEEE